MKYVNKGLDKLFLIKFKLNKIVSLEKFNLTIFWNDVEMKQNENKKVKTHDILSHSYKYFS